MSGFIIIGLLIVCVIGAQVAAEWKRKRRIASLAVVKIGVEYPNNFHVLGVGYYHAGSGKWFPYAWNEFREGRGYYSDGQWSSQPDLRLTTKSIPADQEVERVNRAWRDADPDCSQRFWDSVERDGFGIAIHRSEGS